MIRWAGWSAGIALAMAALIWPALDNGFPLVFYDTGAYIGRGIERTLEPGRSLFYGLFLYITSFGWPSAWGPAVWWTAWTAILAQAGLTLWLLHLFVRAELGRASLALIIAIAIGVALFSAMPWYAAQWMPDALVAPCILGAWLLGFRWAALNPVERGGAAAIVILAVWSHMATLALAVGLAIAVQVAWLLRRHLPGTPRAAPVAGAVLGAVLLMPALTVPLAGSFSFTPGGPVFIFGRLVQDGIVGRYLDIHCPVPELRFCAYRDTLPKSADEFIWGSGSPFWALGGWHSPELDGEMRTIIRQSLVELPLLQIKKALTSAVEQFVAVRTGDGLADYQAGTQGEVKRLLPQHDADFQAAKQQRGQITPQFFETLNLVHRPVALAGEALLIATFAWALWRRQTELAWLSGFLLVALLGNAFICGVLSNPHDRYQSRIAWLAWLAPAIALWRSRIRASA